MQPRNYQRVQDFGNNPHLPGERDSNLTNPVELGGGHRDFLTPNAKPEYENQSELTRLLAEQSDFLQDIAHELRKQNADVLCTAVVKGTSQLSNAITDTNSHEVVFQVGGKPVEVYKIFAYNTYINTAYLSVLSLASVNDGIPIATGGSFDFIIPTYSVFVMLSALAAGTCPVNGPTNSEVGGLFLYGYTIPDYDRVRGSVRS